MRSAVVKELAACVWSPNCCQRHVRGTSGRSPSGGVGAAVTNDCALVKLGIQTLYVNFVVAKNEVCAWLGVSANTDKVANSPRHQL